MDLVELDELGPLNRCTGVRVLDTLKAAQVSGGRVNCKSSLWNIL